MKVTKRRRFLIELTGTEIDLLTTVLFEFNYSIEGSGAFKDVQVFSKKLRRSIGNATRGWTPKRNETTSLAKSIALLHKGNP